MRLIIDIDVSYLEAVVEDSSTVESVINVLKSAVHLLSADGLPDHAEMSDADGNVCAQIMLVEESQYINIANQNQKDN